MSVLYIIGGGTFYASYDGQFMNVYHCKYFEWKIIVFSRNYTIAKSIEYIYLIFFFNYGLIIGLISVNVFFTNPMNIHRPSVPNKHFTSVILLFRRRESKFRRKIL